METMILGCKNKYGYTIKQLEIDYNSKTYKVGNFVIKADKIITQKEMNRIIETLSFLGFKEEK